MSVIRADDPVAMMKRVSELAEQVSQLARELAAERAKREQYESVFEAMGSYDHDHPTVVGLRTTYKLRAEKAEQALAALQARTDALVRALERWEVNGERGSDVAGVTGAIAAIAEARGK